MLQTRLLRVVPEDRATCREVVQELERLYSLCMKNPDYCIGVSGKSDVQPRPDLSIPYDSDMGPDVVH